VSSKVVRTAGGLYGGVQIKYHSQNVKEQIKRFRAIEMSVRKTAPVAMQLARSAALPAESRSPMMPEPTIAVTSRAVPRNSLTAARMVYIRTSEYRSAGTHPRGSVLREQGQGSKRTEQKPPGFLICA
jgi:hypothetical protein